MYRISSEFWEDTKSLRFREVGLLLNLLIAHYEHGTEFGLEADIEVIEGLLAGKAKFGAGYVAKNAPPLLMKFFDVSGNCFHPKKTYIFGAR